MNMIFIMHTFGDPQFTKNTWMVIINPKFVPYERHSYIHQANFWTESISLVMELLGDYGYLVDSQYMVMVHDPDCKLLTTISCDAEWVFARLIYG